MPTLTSTSVSTSLHPFTSLLLTMTLLISLPAARCKDIVLQHRLQPTSLCPGIYDNEMVPDVCFRFLDLPAELRNIIYTILLVHGDLKIKKRPGSPVPKMHHSSVSANMLEVNRQVYEEAAPILYGINTFELFTSYSMLAFARQIDSSIQYLR